MQDGRSASLTAPNGSAQRALLLSALGRAGVSPGELDVVEAHGTGTGLGDPTEAGSLGATMASVKRERPLSVGAAKANLGHTEAPSGLVGLWKVLHQLTSSLSVGNAQLRVLNPLVGQRLSASSPPFVLPTQSSLSTSDGRPWGLSSFGFGGSIAHATLQAGGGPAAARPARLRYERVAFVWTSGSGVRRDASTLTYTSCWVPCAEPVAAASKPRSWALLSAVEPSAVGLALCATLPSAALTRMGTLDVAASLPPATSSHEVIALLLDGTESVCPSASGV